eukprot:gene7062-11225_t
MNGVSSFPAKIEYTGPSLISVAACDKHTIVLNSNGIALTFGYNVDGRLGIGSTNDQKNPSIVSYVGLPFTRVACWSHSLFLDNNGTVFGAGSNAFGKTALGNVGSSKVPKKTIFTAERVTEIAAGNLHSLFLSVSGAVYAIGGNSRGQLGIPSIVGVSFVPLQIQMNETISKITVGEQHSLLLSITGNLYVFGDNSEGQLGDGTTTSRNSPFKLPFNGNIQNIAGGKYHSLFLTNTSEVYTFGRNIYGELCDGTSNPSYTPQLISSNDTFQDVSAGSDHTMLLTTSNDVYSCGRNDIHLLGNLGIIHSKIPTKTFNVGKKFKQISAANRHSVVLSTDGICHTFGSNGNLQLGVTSINPTIPNVSDYQETSRIAKISAGNQFSIVLSANKTGFSFGNNNVGNLGSGDLETKVYPTKLYFNETIDEISAGFQHSMILSKGAVHTVGYNQYGELGVGSTFLKATNFNEINYFGPGIVRISAGAYFSMILTSNGEVHSFGKNDVGQLGDGTNIDRYSPVMIQNGNSTTINGTMNGTLVTRISCGNSHSLILTAGGNVYSFGLNSFGQLGNGNLTNKNTPSSIENTKNEIFIEISAGGFHSLLLSNLGVVFAFGKNHKGQLGIGNTISISIPTMIRNETFNETISKISAGESHSLILDSELDVFSFGDNTNGQLGIGNSNDQTVATLIKFSRNRIIDISAGFDHSLILEDNVWTNTPQNSPQVSPERSSMYTPMISPEYSPINSPKKSPNNSPQPSPEYSPKYSYGKPAVSIFNSPSSPKQSTTAQSSPSNSPVSISTKSCLSFSLFFILFALLIL